MWLTITFVSYVLLTQFHYTGTAFAQETNASMISSNGTDSTNANGISTSMPRDVQDVFVRSIVGLEKAEFIRYGYAVEYDCIDALTVSLF